MEERQRHRDCYVMYRNMQPRNLRKLARDFGVSGTTITAWNSAFGWKERLMLHDKEMAEGIEETMMPDWIEAKADLLKAALEQVRLGQEAGIVPANTQGMMAASKEARAIMGETDASVNVDMRSVNVTVQISPDMAKKIGEALAIEGES